MAALVVECLRCGSTRLTRRTVWRQLESPECPRCGYLGWSPVLEPAEPGRDRQGRPAAPRHLRPVA